MKIRVFRNMCNGIYRIMIDTQDWSQDELKLMCQFGEPEVDVGGTIVFGPESIAKAQGIEESYSKEFGHQYVRIMHGFPYSRGFDTRDYEDEDETVAVAVAWKETVIDRIREAVEDLRSKSAPIPTEEIVEM